jgi:hypothetical protein
MEEGHSVFVLNKEIWPLVPMLTKAERNQSETKPKKPAWLSPTG